MDQRHHAASMLSLRGHCKPYILTTLHYYIITFSFSHPRIGLFSAKQNIVAPIREIQEVKNAIKTYEMYPHLDAFKEEDLDTVHDKYPNITDSAWNVLGYLGAHNSASATEAAEGPAVTL